MKILRRIPRKTLKVSRVVAAIGIFDGVHRGHQAILKKGVSRARAVKGTSVAVTFYPHPLTVLHPALVPDLLLSLEQRLEVFARLGIRIALVIPFTHSFSAWTPQQFVQKVLQQGLGASEVVVGHDFGFGRNRSGTVETLRRFGEKAGFRTHVVPPVCIGKKRISSRKIREWIRKGNLRKAQIFLGRPVGVSGRVIRGSSRGRKLGFPTANLKIQAGLLPPRGVYAVTASTRRGGWGGMANIGLRPTFKQAGGPAGRGEKPLLLEVHLFGQRSPLYGKVLRVEFLRRIRAERRFPSAQALRRRLEADERRARGILALHRKRRMVPS